MDAVGMDYKARLDVLPSEYLGSVLRDQVAQFIATGDIESFDAERLGADTPGQGYQVVFIPSSQRGGVLAVGPGAEGMVPVWTDAVDAADVLRRVELADCLNQAAGHGVPPGTDFARLAADPVPNGQYIGKVVAVEGSAVIQDVGRGALVKHEVAGFARIPMVGDSLDVKYTGKAMDVVRESPGDLQLKKNLGMGR